MTITVHHKNHLRITFSNGMPTIARNVQNRHSIILEMVFTKTFRPEFMFTLLRKAYLFPLYQRKKKSKGKIFTASLIEFNINKH